MKAKHKPDIDPQLEKLLASAGDDGTIEAVLMFRRAGGSANSVPEQEEIKTMVASLAASDPMECNFFPNLGAVAIRAKGRTVKRLLKHPELAVATVNRL